MPINVRYSLSLEVHDKAVYLSHELLFGVVAATLMLLDPHCSGKMNFLDLFFRFYTNFPLSFSKKGTGYAIVTSS